MRYFFLIGFALMVAIHANEITRTEETSVSTCSLSNGRIKGKGKVITETRKLESFEKICNAGIFNIKIVQSDESKVVVTVHENIMRYVATEVKDGMLSIYFDTDSSIDEDKHDIVVYTPNCNIIANETIGSISCDKLTASSLTIRNIGIGKVKLTNVSADQIDITNEGIGKTEIQNIKANIVTVKNDGIGSIELSGTANEAYYGNEGIGKIKASKLTATKIEASNEGLGKINARNK